MKIFRVSNPNIQENQEDPEDPHIPEDLKQEALKYDSAEDFMSAFSVKQNLINEGITINNDDTVTLYHATTPDKIKKIIEEGVIKGGSTATGGMTGLKLKPSAFFGTDKIWVEQIWGGKNGNLIEVNVPFQYIRQPAQNKKEVYFEGGLKRVNDNLWIPNHKPRSTFYDRIPAKDYNLKNEPYTLEYIWNLVHKK